MSKSTTSKGKNPAAVELGRLGGLKGGQARAQALSKTQRSAIAKLGAQARAKKLSAEQRSAIAKKAGLAQRKKLTVTSSSSPEK